MIERKVAESDRLVHIVDDDGPFRDSLRLMLEAHGFEVCEYNSGPSFIEASEGPLMGCALVDVNMPELTGLALQELLNSRNIAVPVIIMTGVADVSTAVRAMKAGAVDFIEKPFELATVLHAIQSALCRVAPNEEESPDITDFKARLSNLTSRERQILEAVVAGSPTKIIAYELNISPRTVHAHRARIGNKLGVTGLSNLVRLAITSGVKGRGRGQ